MFGQDRNPEETLGTHRVYAMEIQNEEGMSLDRRVAFRRNFLVCPRLPGRAATARKSTPPPYRLPLPE